MDNLKTRPRYVWILVSAILMIAVVSGVGVTRSKLAGKQKKQWPPFQQVTDALPPVTSKVRNVEVVSATIENQGRQDATAAIELWNNSDKAITGVTLTAGDISVGHDGAISPEVPVAVVEPFGRITVRFVLSNLEKDVPIFVGGVIYADGSEDGQDIVLEVMHKHRAQGKAKRDAKKGAPKQ